MNQVHSELETNLSATLERDERTADSQIGVLDNNGVITLGGIALSHEARAAAAEIAEGYPGVISVINDITVGDPDATDEPRIVVPLPLTKQQ